jgi:hypothetical protein
VKWAVQAWHNNIKDATILNCFHKLTVQQTVFTQQTFDNVNSGANILYNEAVTDLQTNIDGLQRAQIVQQPMDINRFVNPIEESTEVQATDIDQDVLNEFTHGPDFESDEEVEEQPIIKASEALEAAKLVELWHLQRKDSDEHGIEVIRKQISKLEAAQQIERQEGKQGKLDNWLVKK